MRIAMTGLFLLLSLTFAIPCSAGGEPLRQQPNAPWTVRRSHPLVMPRPALRRRIPRLPFAALVPVITKITPDHGAPHDSVLIEGANFHATNYAHPYDPNPGYNTVRIGKTKASHVPVTTTRMWMQVPEIPEGTVTVTVETQNGMSNPVPFTVERNWWNFWSPKASHHDR